MNKAVLGMTIAVGLSSEIALAQASVPSAPSPLNFGDKFLIYIRQTYSVSGVLVPAAFAGLDQVADSPNEWGQGSRCYLNRLGTQRGQFQIGAHSALSASAPHSTRIRASSHRENTGCGGVPRTSQCTPSSRARTGERRCLPSATTRRRLEPDSSRPHGCRRARTP
jgi:hypothetical protein